MGWGYSGNSWAEKPLINVSGIARIGRKGAYIMTENYYISFDEDEYLLLLSIGGRNLVSSVSIDYGLFIPIFGYMETFFAIPWLGITIPFGKKK